MLSESPVFNPRMPKGGGCINPPHRFFPWCFFIYSDFLNRLYVSVPKDKRRLLVYCTLWYPHPTRFFSSRNIPGSTEKWIKMHNEWQNV